MFNLFRRKRGSTENLAELPEKMLDEELGLPDENQNTERECVAARGVLMKPLSPSEAAQSVRAARHGKKVRWAEVMEQVRVQVEPDYETESQVSSSEDEAEQRTGEDEEEDQSEEEDGEESSKEDEEEEVEDGEEEEEEEEVDDEESDDEEEEKDALERTDLKESAHMEELKGLKHQLEQIDKDVSAKTSLIDRLQTELREAYEDAEIAKFKMSNLEIELEETKQNLEQAHNHDSETESDDEAERALREEKLKEAEDRISELEEQLREVIKEKEELETSLNQLKTDRDQQIAHVQKAYEEALKEQDEMIAKFEEDFEELRTLNSRREQQLLDDFEWKLREVEKTCKTRVEKRDRDKDREIAELVCNLADANTKLQEVKKLELTAAELEQTKLSNTELKRNLRTTNRKFEEVQVNEKVLQEETIRLRSQLDKEKSFVSNLQIVHREELDERERKMNFRLESQKNLLNSEWEERLKRETRQMKLDMERRVKEDTNSTVEQIRKQTEKTISSLKADHEEKTKQLLSQVEELKKTLSETEQGNKEVLENIQTRSDGELVEMRRKMEKLYMSYEEKIEKLNEQHEQQINGVQEECEKRVQQVESNSQMQAGTSRTTVELVKEQLHRENQARLQQLENQHQRQLEEQWCRMNRDKEEALRAQENKHIDLVKQIQYEMDQLKNFTAGYHQKDKTEVDQMRDTSPTMSNSHSLQTITNQAQNQTSPDRSSTQQSMRAELGEAEANLVREKERLADLTLKAKMCQTIQQLTLQLDASKKEIETLNSRLNIKNSGTTPTVSEVIHPLTKEPPEPPPRSRGRYNAANIKITDKTTDQVKETQHTIPTAKVQPQNFLKEPQAQPTANLQQSAESIKVEVQQLGKEVRSTPTAKIQPQLAPVDEQRPAPPAVKVQVQPNQQLNQQSYNQSRRSRKHRSRRH